MNVKCLPRPLMETLPTNIMTDTGPCDHPCLHCPEWGDLPGYEFEYDSEEEGEGVEEEGDEGNVEADGAPDETEGGPVHRGDREKKINRMPFSEADKQLQNGWLGVFYRQGEGAPPLYAVVTKPDPVERPYHPTLLLKGTARPLSRNECPPERRYASEMAAVAWVAFGGFERIYFRELLPPPMPTTTTHVTRPLLEDVKGFVNHVRNIEHTDKEKGRLRDAQTDEERAAMAATLVVAHMYHQLGVLAPHPDEVEVGGLEGLLPLGRQLEVKVPRVKVGPLRRDGGRLPMLARWV